MVSDAKNKYLFQITSTIEACGINLWTTTEGVYLTLDAKAKDFEQKAFMKTELLTMFDYNAAEKYFSDHTNEIQSDKDNTRICSNLLTSLRLFRNQEDNY